MENKKIIKIIIVNFFITFGISIMMFLQNKYFIENMGIDKLGLIKLYNQILGYLNIIELGLGSAATYAFYKPLAMKDNEKISIILNTINILYKKIFIIIVLIGVSIIPLLFYIIHNKTLTNIEIIIYWLIFLISSVLNYLYVKYVILFTADQRYGFVRLVQGICKIISQGIQILIIIKYQSILFFLVIMIVENLVQHYIFFLYFKKKYINIKKTKIRDMTLKKDMKFLFFHRVATVIIYNTDMILISRYVSLTYVGLYSSYQMVYLMVLNILNIILNVLRPSIGKFIATNDKNNNFKLWKSLNIILISISVVLSYCTFSLITQFIKLWLNTEVVFSKFTILLLTVNSFIQCSRVITDIFKESYGFFDDIYLPIIESCLNFIISILLVKRIGIDGILIGTLISNISIIYVGKPILIFKRCFDKRIKDYIIIYLNYVVLTGISIFIIETLKRKILVHKVINWKFWIRDSIVLFLLSNIIVFIIFYINIDFKNSIKYLINKLLIKLRERNCKFKI